MQNLWQDVRFGARMLAKSPSFTAIAVLTLALGIGANTAIFSLLNAIMLSSVPVHDPQHLVVLQWSSHTQPQGGYSSYGDCSEEGGRSLQSGCSFSYPMFREIQSKVDGFSDVAGFAGPAQLNLAGNGTPSLAQGEFVSGGYFQTLGVGAAAGRTLESDDDAPGAEPVVVLRYGYWQSTFGAASAVIGKKIQLNGVPLTIVGVADPSFTRMCPGKAQDLWLPLTVLPRLRIDWGRDKENPSNWWLTLVARLKTATPPAQAQAAASLVFRNSVLYGAKPLLKDSDDPRIAAVPVQEGLTGIRNELATPIYLLMAAVGVVLLIACANVAGLLLARGNSREREMAVRLALGAGRARIIRQLLVESVLLSGAGAILGILLASWGAYSLAALLSANWPSQLIIDVGPDARVLAFTAAVATVTGILFGLAPAFRGSRVDVTPTLKQTVGSLPSTSHASSRRFSLGTTLVVAQVALSVLILVGSGLLVRTLINLKSIDPGFDTHNVLLFGIDPTLADYKPDHIQNLYRDLQTQLAAVPGVVSASYSSDALLDGSLWTTSVHIEGQSDNSTAPTQMLAVGPGFFETMRIPLLVGRTFAAREMDSASPVVIVNQAFARKYLANRNAVGLHIGKNGKDEVEREIVGIVADAKYDSLRKDVAPTAYIPVHGGGVRFALRTASSAAGIVPAVRQIASRVDSNLPLFDVRTQSETVDRRLFGERLVARLSALFGLLALVLACVGLYGLLSYEVTRRTREIGIRSALGAQQRDVLRLVVGQGTVLALVGAAIGACVALAVLRYLQSLLYGVRASDPVTFAVVALLLAVVALLACWVPARRAARVDPVVALRYE
jgi:predicted permease